MMGFDNQLQPKEIVNEKKFSCHAQYSALFSMKLVAPTPDTHKANIGSDAQADVVDQYALDKELTPYEVDLDYGAPRWAYRGHYRSIFPPMF